MKQRKHMTAIFAFSLILNQFIVNPVYADEQIVDETKAAEETVMVKAATNESYGNDTETVDYGTQTEGTTAPEESVINEEPEYTEPQETIEVQTEETANLKESEDEQPANAVIATVQEVQEELIEKTSEPADEEKAVESVNGNTTEAVSEVIVTVPEKTEEKQEIPEETSAENLKKAEEINGENEPVAEAPKMSLRSAPLMTMSVPGNTVEAASSPQPDNLVLHYYNIYSTIIRNTNDKTVSIIPNQTKTVNGTAGYNNVGGKNSKGNYEGIEHTFQNAFIINSSEGPVFVNNADEIALSSIVSKVNYKGNGVVVVTYAGGSKETLENTSELYISPVYKRDPAWYLDFSYIDEISTGSGSASNHNAVTSYTHTFKEPEGQQHYEFVEWRYEDAEENIYETYQKGDKFTYTGEGQEPYTRKEITVYAYWQPSDTINYHEDGKAVYSSEEFVDQTVEIRPEDEEMYRFA